MTTKTGFLAAVMVCGAGLHAMRKRHGLRGAPSPPPERREVEQEGASIDDVPASPESGPEPEPELEEKQATEPEPEPASEPEPEPEPATRSAFVPVLARLFGEDE